MKTKKELIYIILALLAVGGLALIILIARESGRGVRPVPVEEPAPVIEEEDQVIDEEDSSQKITVEMEDLSFQPETLSIQAGDTVFWVNTSALDHTVTGFGVDELVRPGETFEYTFDQSGTYDYVCTIHPGMDGTIIVE